MKEVLLAEKKSTHRGSAALKCIVDFVLQIDSFDIDWKYPFVSSKTMSSKHRLTRSFRTLSALLYIVSLIDEFYL